MNKPKIGSAEWIEYVKNMKTPRSSFSDAVEDTVYAMTGESLHMLFAVESAKADSDFSRILEIIHDFFDQSVSVDETANHVKDFLISHGYIKN